MGNNEGLGSFGIGGGTPIDEDVEGNSDVKQEKPVAESALPVEDKRNDSEKNYTGGVYPAHVQAAMDLVAAKHKAKL
jgi:hypothetical protein